VRKGSGAVDAFPGNLQAVVPLRPKKKEKKLHSFSQQANYTDRATGTCQQS
jgi:hypothetical protein